ncbi:LPS translocon maturation chaperone LptM [Methylovirgula sp. 4M-Z18]|uniref:LPS translocon maturation chaperone LptM n=1 Tax=Methylovirgula sp. 4M-Z18 TaxID=2293567 RepID=UPI0013149F63|nr:lipoprotein [Methylovirgula sp. 4M-Z18]
MNRPFRVLPILALVALVGLSGCGRKGPLAPPPPPDAEQKVDANGKPVKQKQSRKKVPIVPPKIDTPADWLL